METKDMENNNDATLQMTTLSEQVNDATKNGYTHDFDVKGYGIVDTSGKVHTSDQVKIVNFYRFEGYSDPQDNSILYLLEANDGIKGKIIDAYGVDANPNISKFIGEVEKMNKKS